ncbi:phosphohistidine phosphatase [Planctomycetes bacterium CA13]|uniref:Phosphohistidine phosphatase n=1 Tax=Novipirellula herctigrandis TaxID=2527986 RepID=A0A5C5Z6V8_9BACT|nr:phosphohistidine phosphatase [Planctomycetes bacterium CA13]
MTPSNPDETAALAPRRLILMRHAKSDWSNAGLSDHDRPLNRRGQRDAPRMAGWLGSIDCWPDKVLCSSAVRTCETLELLKDEFETDPVICFSNLLYCATAATILDVIRSESGEARTLLLIAHNPGISELASHFSDQFIGMSTAAMVVFETSISQWGQLQANSPMTMIHNMRPKAL